METERITLNVNDVRTDPEGESFDVKISLARTCTVKELKQVIAKRMSLSMNEFYLVRHANDREIRELNQKLTYTGLSNHSQIKIVMGTPQLEGVYQVKMSVVKLIDGAKDNEIFEVEPLGQLIVNPEHTGAAFKN